jgi:predicted TPR repeat methyltransferase
MAEMSYKESHKYAGKGAEYEQYYETDAWEKFLWSCEQEIILRILDKYLAGREIRLLDFACGTGRIAAFLENRVTTATGVDVSGSMLEVARNKLRRTEIIETDITTGDALKGRKFNLITAFRFFLNAESQLRSAAMKALAELLDDDGMLVFNNHHSLGSPWIRLLHRRHLRKNPDGIFNVMSIDQMNSLAESAGLEIIELCPAGFFHPPKIPVSYRLNRAIDRAACKVKSLHQFSESPIAVCRRRRAARGNN